MQKKTEQTAYRLYTISAAAFCYAEMQQPLFACIQFYTFVCIRQNRFFTIGGCGS